MAAPLASRAPILALAAALGACAPRTGPAASTVTIAASAVVPAPVAVAAGPDALVWSVDGDGKPTTRWLATVPQGAAGAPRYRQVAQAPDILIGAGAGVWRWRAREVTVPTSPCTEFNNQPAGDGIATSAVMERLGAPGGAVAERAVVIAGTGEAGANEIHHSATPVGSIGPYLFVRESTYAYSCGAHGFTGVSMMVWDVARREKADLLQPAERAAVDTAARAEAQRLFSADTSEEAPKLEDVAYMASLPRYGAHGWLHVDHAFSSFACYACGDGVWSSYTRSVKVPAHTLPERTRPYAHAPEVVAAYLDDHPGEALAGWSAVPPEAAPVLGAALGSR